MLDSSTPSIFGAWLRGEISMAGKSWKELGAILVLSLAVGPFAIATGTQKDRKKAATTVNGCLQKLDDADEFAITSENGDNYELVSRDIKLSPHVGHKVSVTGTLVEEEHDGEESEQIQLWTGRIYVTSLKNDQ
jgi:hypothetical protein